jgi:hypothetical protein
MQRKERKKERITTRAQFSDCYYYSRRILEKDELDLAVIVVVCSHLIKDI